MSQTGDEIKTLITETKEAVANVAADIDRVIAQIPQEGGLSAAETAEIRGLLISVRDDAQAAAGKVPEPPAEG